MKATGLMINNKVKELKHGLMVLNTKETILKEKNMVKEILNGLMEVIILENLIIIILKVMVFIIGQMEENI